MIIFVFLYLSIKAPQEPAKQYTCNQQITDAMQGSSRRECGRRSHALCHNRESGGAAASVTCYMLHPEYACNMLQKVNLSFKPQNGSLCFDFVVDSGTVSTR
ncbi:hypothetical protein AB205_0119990 [Aquarana catesbeiana]|uniref:Uncharacterized protein n=1 Tax=Aquarana catesbeiana TaxID=8400 RepID=A0A2G9NKB6_AQUCT|nr:hypothetical protein AB205_0119990 [Aquarana catesbeiana]